MCKSSENRQSLPFDPLIPRRYSSLVDWGARHAVTREPLSLLRRALGTNLSSRIASHSPLGQPGKPHWFTSLPKRPPLKVTEKGLIPRKLRTPRLLRDSELYRGFESPSPPHSLDSRECWLHSSKNRRKSPQFRRFLVLIGAEKMSGWISLASFRVVFSEGHCGSTASSTPQGEGNAITNR